MSTRWIGVAAAKHVALGVAGGFAMLAHGRHDAVKRVQPGDWLSYYSPREGLNEGAEVRAFTAIGQVKAGDPAERHMLPGMTGWYREVEWLDGRRADIYPLLDEFSFVTDRSHWGMYFRKSLFKVTRDDFALIAQAMGVAGAFERLSKS